MCNVIQCLHTVHCGGGRLACLALLLAVAFVLHMELEHQRVLISRVPIGCKDHIPPTSLYIKIVSGCQPIRSNIQDTPAAQQTIRQSLTADGQHYVYITATG